MMAITVAIDKLEKIGLEKVKEELVQRGLEESRIAVIQKYLSITGSNAEKLTELKKLMGENETAKKGIKEMEYILDYKTAGFQPPLLVDLTLARGLDYYTGIIFEVKAPHTQMGSISGGGRYDDLTGLFGFPGIPGVGISFGVDRIYDVMEEMKLFPEEVYTGTQVLFFHAGELESKTAFGLMQQLRSRGIGCELYHEEARFDKQFKYAEKKNIPYAVIIGSIEMQDHTCTLKNLKSGEQKTFAQSELSAYPF
jgi:histidyl-tRNA synthetase